MPPRFSASGAGIRAESEPAPSGREGGAKDRNMKVFITGINGQLGHDVAKVLEERNIPYRGLSSKALDITDPAAVSAELCSYRPDAVLHCAAFTKVDLAEEQPGRCWDVNAAGTRNLALVCRDIGAKLLYVSTDYVFPGAGDAPYQTGDAVNPLNVYGMTKLAGELAVKSLLENYFIVRTSWVIGIHGQNFVKTMLRLAQSRSELSVVDDQIGSPTFTADLAPLLCDMIETEEYGLYHATNEGLCSWAELAETVFRLSGKNVKVNHVSTEQYPAKAARPRNSRLDKSSLSEHGFSRLPAWEQSLARFLETLREEQPIPSD